MIVVRHTKTLASPSSGGEDKVYGEDWNEVHVIEGLGTSADKDVGSGAGQVAAGDHGHAEYAAAGHNHDASYAPLVHAHPGGSEAFPVGSVFIAVVSTDPATLLGYGTWAAFGAGRVLVGFNAADSDFDAAKKTGGAKTHTLTANEMPSHTHVQDAHTHVQNSHNHTQDAHTHTQNAHNHTQDAHSHTYASQTATTGAASSYEHGAIDTSSAAAESSISVNAATATNQAATAVNQNATATNQAATAVNQNATAVNQSTGGGLAHNNMQPFLTAFFWERTA